jgi:hypothetical protein
VTFILRKGTEIVATVNVGDTKAFRLPAGYKSDVFSVEVVGQSIIKEVRFGETMESLKTV